jgi:hypothetical protein
MPSGHPLPGERLVALSGGQGRRPKGAYMSWSRISVNDIVPQAWRNGGGQTRELMAWPHAHDWAVRVSVAQVEASGPFSAFEGVQRWLGVLRGKGLRLFDWAQFPGDELLSFDGHLAPESELIDGPCQVLNLMHRRAKGVLSVEVASHALVPRCDWVGLFTVSGGLLEHGARAMPIAPMTLAWCEEPALQSCVFTGDGACWWICWSEVAE